MIVTGGVYSEKCAHPHWERLFGSGGRAASALAKISPQTILHSYLSNDLIESFQLSAAALGFRAELTPIRQRIEFEYLHPLSHPIISGLPKQKCKSIDVKGDVILRFDFLEGDAIINARRAIYDPQTQGIKKGFWENGSTCDQLAVVLNEWESLTLTKLPASESGFKILEIWNADIVVIKLGTKGVSVFERGKDRQDLPAYKSDRVFKIGSGDVFSAVFAHCWGERDLEPVVAAEYASKAVADYVETRSLPVASIPSSTSRREHKGQDREPLVYLAGPFFDISQRWLVEECRSSLESLGAQVFSPIHDVGSAENNPHVADADLKGLRESHVVLALLDSKDIGTIFEVGYAKRLKMPVVGLAERLPAHERTMLTGTGCLLVDDLCTALYQTLWASD